MNRLSLMDKLNSLWNVSTSTWITLLIIVFILGIAYFTYYTKKNNIKKTKEMYIGIYTIVIMLFLIFALNNISYLLDDLTNNIFMLVYFPTFAIYTLALVISNIIFLKTIFDKHYNKHLKKINIIIFIILMYLFALLLEVIFKNNLNVFKQATVYANKDAHALIEIYSSVFIVWILFLVIYKIYAGKKVIIKKVIVTKEVPVEIEKIVEVDKTVNNNIEETKIQKAHMDVSSFDIEVLETEEKVKSTIVDDMADNIFTLEDYKLMLEILKNKKRKSKKVVTEKSRITSQDDLLRQLYGLNK